LELSLVENLIKYAHRHGFVPGLDRPIRSWLSLGHQRGDGQETLSEDEQRAHGYLSADDLRCWKMGRGLPGFRTDDNKARQRANRKLTSQLTKSATTLRIAVAMAMLGRLFEPSASF
jgi:hypothetical protein